MSTIYFPLSAITIRTTLDIKTQPLDLVVFTKWKSFKSIHSCEMERFSFGFPFFCCALFGIFGGNGFNISPKIFNITEMGPCPESNEMQMQFNVTTRVLSQRNEYLFNGTIMVLAEIGGRIEVTQAFFPFKMDLNSFRFSQLRTRTQRCSLDMTYCEDFNILTFRNVCARMLEKNTLWSELVSNIHPKFGCPFQKVSVTCLCETSWTSFNLNSHKQGTYTVSNAAINLSMLSRLPIDGYTWLLYLRFFAIINRQKTPLFCIRVEVTVSLAKGKQPNHQWPLQTNPSYRIAWILEFVLFRIMFLFKFFLNKKTLQSIEFKYRITITSVR